MIELQLTTFQVVYSNLYHPVTNFPVVAQTSLRDVLKHHKWFVIRVREAPNIGLTRYNISAFMMNVYICCR